MWTKGYWNLAWEALLGGDIVPLPTYPVLLIRMVGNLLGNVYGKTMSLPFKGIHSMHICHV